MERAKQTFPIIVEKDEDGFFVAINPSLPGCYSQGKTLDEALANVREATALCLESLSAEETGAPGATDISIHLIAA